MADGKAGASGDAPAFLLAGNPRWGLCCQFVDSPIKFRQATHRYCATLSPDSRDAYLSAIVLDNALSLSQAIERCAELGIRAFRVTSQILPLATHPVSGYELASLPDGEAATRELVRARDLARDRDVRLSLHPDQFVVINSESPTVVASSVTEMEHQATVARLIGAEALTLHAGGKAGGTASALDRLERGIDLLSEAARGLLALENDDRSFTPGDLLPFCERMRIPFVYDVHHHRCNLDDLSVSEASERAASTWGDREPWMHISSPKDGWASANPRAHAGYIDLADVPEAWTGKRMTIDVEAKEKERAVLRLMQAAAGEQAA